MNRETGEEKKKKNRIAIKKWFLVLLALAGSLLEISKFPETDFVGSIGKDCSSSCFRGACC